MKKIGDRKLYFIAILPSLVIIEELQKLKEYFRDTYKSKASLNSPPHITLHMPFDWKEKKEDLLLEKLTAFSSSTKACEIQLKNFNSFEPRVIYVDVEENKSLKNTQLELFRFCKKELNLFNAQYKELPFHPHITLAFRDLKKPLFYKAWDEFKVKSYSATFNFECITLLKHNGKHWDVFKQFAVGEKN